MKYKLVSDHFILIEASPEIEAGFQMQAMSLVGLYMLPCRVCAR